jgi:hypothetical protein
MDVAAFYGNCQAAALGRILADHEPFAQRFAIELLPPVYNLQNGDHQRVLEAASRAKVFVHQPISAAKFLPAVTANIMAAIPPSSMSFCFPALWFDAYGPDVQYLTVDPAEDRAPSCYHSAILLEAYLLGRSVEAAARTYDDPDALDPAAVRQIMRDAVQRLREREAWEVVNVRVAYFVEMVAAQRRLFHTFNHPSSVLLCYLANELLGRLGLPPVTPAVRSRHENILSALRMPEMLAVHSALGLRFDRCTEFAGSLGLSDTIRFAEARFRHQARNVDDPR